MKKNIITAVSIVVAIVIIVSVASIAVSADEPAVGNSAAAVKYMKQSCTICHSVPDPSTIRPYDIEGATEFLTEHIDTVPRTSDDVNNMIAYFFHLD